MDYVKRNEALGDWNFEVSDMTFGQEIMDRPAVVKVAKGLMWALYQLAFPQILKKYPQIAEYSIKVSYNRIFGSAGVEMHFVFE